MNITNISDLPWFWIWLGAGLAFAVISTGLLRFSQWQARRRVGRYAEPQVVQSTGVVKFAKAGIKVLPSVVLIGADEEQPTGTGAVTLDSVVQTGSGVMLPSGAGISPTGPSAKLSH